MKAILVAVFLVLILITTHAGADPITMTFSDSGGGNNAGSSGNTVSIGGRTVTNAPFTIAAVSDMSTRITNTGADTAGFSLISISASKAVRDRM